MKDGLFFETDARALARGLSVAWMQGVCQASGGANVDGARRKGARERCADSVIQLVARFIRA